MYYRCILLFVHVRMHVLYKGAVSQTQKWACYGMCIADIHNSVISNQKNSSYIHRFNLTKTFAAHVYWAVSFWCPQLFHFIIYTWILISHNFSFFPHKCRYLNYVLTVFKFSSACYEISGRLVAGYASFVNFPFQYLYYSLLSVFKSKILTNRMP